MTVRVLAVDVGSVRKNFGWAALHRAPTGGYAVGCGTDPGEAAAVARASLTLGIPVAIGVEAPLAVPVGALHEPDGWVDLGRARAGEVTPGSSRPWSAGAGAGALATGLVQLTWILSLLARGTACTTDPRVWLSRRADVFLWEAFVTGAAKPAGPAASTAELREFAASGPHALDAAVAASTFADRLERGELDQSDVTCGPAAPLNLAAAAALRAGLSIDVAELSRDVCVYRTPPAAAVLATGG